MILRLVDIVLTLFFGFICIATLDETGQVQLALSPHANLRALESSMLVVTVNCDGGILLSDTGAPISNQRLEKFLTDLQSKLDSEANVKNAKLKIKIRVDRECPVSALKKVVTICDKLKLQRSIAVKVKFPKGGQRS